MGVGVHVDVGVGVRESVSVGISLFAGALLLLVQSVVNVHVPEPYMDEIFHVPEAQRFCLASEEISRKVALNSSSLLTLMGSEFKSLMEGYHPKITTFPGAYALPAMMHVFSRGSYDICSSAAGLRSVNAFYMAGTTFAIFQLLLRGGEAGGSEGTKMTLRKAAAVALVLALSPVSFFSSLLFYTDQCSTFFVLLGLWLSKVRDESFLRGDETVFAAHISGNGHILRLLHSSGCQADKCCMGSLHYWVFYIAHEQAGVTRGGWKESRAMRATAVHYQSPWVYWMAIFGSNHRRSIPSLFYSQRFFCRFGRQGQP